MCKVRRILLCMVAVLVVAAMVAASASAAISFEWQVSGKLLPSGQSRTFDVGTDGKTSVFKFIALGPAELLSSAIKVKPGAQIFGGKPGTSEETVEFEGVIVDKPSGCELKGSPKTITTVPVKSEIVEGASEGKGTGEVYILFTPKSTASTLFTSFEITSKGGAECSFSGLGELTVTGSLLGLALPQRAQATLGDLDYEAAGKEYKTSGGATAKAGLKFAGTVATLSGLALGLLTSKESFGAF